MRSKVLSYGLLIYHIIDIIDAKHGGAQRMLEDFLSIEKSSNEKSDHLFVQILGSPNSQVHTLSNSDSLYSKETLYSIWKFFKTLTATDILHVHLFPALYLASIAKKARILRVKLIFTEHNSHNKRRKLGWLGKQIERWIYKEYDQIVCISKTVQQSLINWIPALESRLVLVYNGIDLSNFKSEEFYEPQKKIISVGRLAEQKNYIKTVTLLKPILDNSDWQYAIAGEGPARQEIESKLLELNLTKSVTLCGRVGQIQEFYKNADVLVLLSKWEGFGLTIVEALAMGLPIIAYRFEGLQEILEPIQNKGVLLLDSELNDSESSQLIRDFLEAKDQDYHRELRIKRAADFDIAHTWYQYKQVYQNILETQR